MSQTSLFDHLKVQLHGLCAVTDADPDVAERLLGDLLGDAGTALRDRPPRWASGVSDDHTPMEYSLAFHRGEGPTLRVLAEALAVRPTLEAHLAAGQAFVRTQAARHGLALDSFDRVRDLFTPIRPQHTFTVWQSLVFSLGRGPEFKVYFNPEISGTEQAPALVRTALERLGLGASYQTLIKHSARAGELGRADRLAFFALDLHGGAHARVKVYVARHDATADDMVRAAEAVRNVDAGELLDFCRIAGGGTSRFATLPLVGSYTFTTSTDEPVGYSLYVPIRGYVSDDEQAHDRVAAVLRRYGFATAGLDRAIAAVTGRPLRDGVGLLAHVSLRLGAPRPGVTVYLSAEAYRVRPPCTRPVPAPADLAVGRCMPQARPVRSESCP
jgi:hypothetical protein